MATLDVKDGIILRQVKVSQKTVTLEKATEILGSKNVLSRDAVAGAWGTVSQSTSASFPIHYDEDTLRRAAFDNERGSAQWKLIFIQGLSLHEQRELRGTSKANRPLVGTKFAWWMKDKERGWVEQGPELGYYLIDFRVRYTNLPWDKQEELLSRIGYVNRVHEAVFSEALLSIFMIHHESLCEYYYHWGRAESAFGGCVVVGDFKNGVLQLGYWRKHRPGINVGVVVYRKWER